MARTQSAQDVQWLKGFAHITAALPALLLIECKLGILALVHSGNNGTDNRNNGTDNRNHGTDNRNHGTDNRNNGTLLNLVQARDPGARRSAVLCHRRLRVLRGRAASAAWQGCECCVAGLLLAVTVPC